MKRTHKAYNSTWRKVRATVLERDAHRCLVGMEGCTGIATQVDHIIPLAFGGPAYELSNLRGACASCNSGRANKLRRKPSRAW